MLLVSVLMVVCSPGTTFPLILLLQSTLPILLSARPETSELPLSKLPHRLLMLAKKTVPRVRSVVVMVLVVALVPTPKKLLLLFVVMAVTMGTHLSLSRCLTQLAPMRAIPFMWLSLGLSGLVTSALVLSFEMFMVRPLRRPSVVISLRPIPLFSILCMTLTAVGAAMCRLPTNLMGTLQRSSVLPTVPLLLRMTMGCTLTTPSRMTLSTMLWCSRLLITVVLLHPTIIAPLARPPTYGSVLNSSRVAVLPDLSE